MTIPNDYHRPLLIGGWLLTLVATYAFAKVTGASPSGTESQGAAPTGDVQPLPGARNLPANSPEAGFAMNASESNAASITGGMPLEQWLGRLVKEPDEILRVSTFLRLLETLETPEEIKQAREIVLASSERGNNRLELSMLLQKWTQQDPKGALAFAQARQGGDRGSAMWTVLRTWTRANPEDALAWAQANPESTDRRGRREGGESMVAITLSQMARNNLDRALQVAGSEEGDGRSRLAATLASELVAQRGMEAARLAIGNVSAGPFRDQLTAEVAGRLAATDAPAAVAWVMSLPADQGRGQALAEAVSRWAQSDAVAAAEYLQKLPAGSESDPARERYAASVLRQDPEGAMAWAGTITDEQQRQQTMVSLGRDWLRRDATAAQNWIAQSELPQALKDRFASRARRD